MNGEQTTATVVAVFLIISGAIGLAIGIFGLGIGLLFLSVSQAIGVALLSTGVGAIAGGCIGCKAILRAIIRACEDLQNK